MHNVGPAPFVPHDVACPVLMSDGELLLQPYVVRGEFRTARPVPLNVPQHLVVLDLGTRGIYVHLDPRQMMHKLDSLVRTGAVASNAWQAWMYTMCSSDAAVGELDTSIHVLFPGTPERFYFNPFRARVLSKQEQIADERYVGAEFYCPVEWSSVATYFRDEEFK